MQTTTALYLLARTALIALRERLDEDRGQTSIEWLGIAAVTVAIVAAMVSGPAADMGDAIKTAFESLIGKLLT